MLYRSFARCSLYVHKSDFIIRDNKSLNTDIMGRPSTKSWNHTRAFVTATSLVIFCVGLINNELKKLKRNIKPLHDIFNFEKKLDRYITVPNYVDDSSEVSFLKKCLKDLIENKSIWDAIPMLTLLKCTISKDVEIQQKAMDILSRRHCSEDSDCLIVSQSIDFPTTLHLSRTQNVDPRFFRSPAPLPLSKESIESQLMQIINTVPRTADDKAHKQFIDDIRKRKLRALSHVDKTVMLGFETFDEVCRDSQRTLDSLVIILLLQAILKHSEDIVNFKLDRRTLYVLRRIYDGSSDDDVVVNIVGKILNNLILNGTDPRLFFEMGWLHIFVQWLKSKKVCKEFNSIKLLNNLELAYGNRLNRAYDDHVCLLHPTYHQSDIIKADVVFIHGINGGPMRTWRQRDRKVTRNGSTNQKSETAPNGRVSTTTTNGNNNCSPGNNGSPGNDVNDNTLSNVYFVEKELESVTSDEHSQCWPKDWLANEVTNLRMLSVEYNTQLTSWTSNDHIERKTLKEQAEILLKSLMAVGIGERPVVLVGHSMGGLLIKQMLCIAAERNDARDLTNRVKGVVFYSVPHRGSYLVNRTKNASYLLHPTDALLQLAEGSTDLKDLHEKFSDLVREKSIKMRSFTEGESTNFPFYIKATVVSQSSSDPGFGDFYVMKDHDHVTICKPRSKNSLIYTLTRDFIKYCLVE